jgi:hypothetical protein
MSDIEPARFQLRRTRGWRKPENSISVARPTMWGNPFVVRGPYPGTNMPYRVYCNDGPGMGRCVAMASDKSAAYQEAVNFFSRWFDCTVSEPYTELHNFREIYGWHGFHLASVCHKLLHGKSLGCWCAPDMPCHADVILKRANPELNRP